MGRVNIVKQVKVDGKWTLRSIPKKQSGHYDWSALPDGDYFIEWREDGRRRRQPAGNTAVQAIEEQRRKRHELEAHALGLAPRNGIPEVVPVAEPPSIRKLIDRYLDQIKTLKKPNTHRKYDAVLTKFAKVFRSIRSQIASAVDLFIQTSRFSDGTRRITHITEVVGMEQDIITLQDIFLFEKTGISESGKVVGRFRATGIRPKFYERLRTCGITLPPQLFQTVVEIH